jgi:hypothetical protein
LALWLPALASLLAQETAALTIRLNRDFGYASLGGDDIQGNFTIEVSGPADLERVEYLIDDLVIGEDAQAPFELPFRTGDYALGPHTIGATGYLPSGEILNSRALQREFVAASAGPQEALKIVGPIIGVLVAVMLLSLLVTTLTGRKRGTLPLGAPRDYGLRGGAICPHCQRPFPLHLFKLNLLTHSLDRCDHCHRWTLVRRASPAALAAAEEAELALAEPGANERIPEPTKEEIQRKLLDESRFDN